MASHRWRHVWDDSPPPQYQGGVRSPFLRDLAGPPSWLPPSEGSRRRLAHHAPLYQSPSFPTGGRGMKSLCTGSPMGEPAPPGRVLTPPNPRLVQSEGGAQARVHPSLRLLRVRWGGGTRRPPDLSHPPDGARASPLGRQRPPGPAPVLPVFGHR